MRQLGIRLEGARLCGEALPLERLTATHPGLCVPVLRIGLGLWQSPRRACLLGRCAVSLDPHLDPGVGWEKRD